MVFISSSDYCLCGTMTELRAQKVFLGPGIPFFGMSQSFLLSHLDTHQFPVTHKTFVCPFLTSSVVWSMDITAVDVLKEAKVICSSDYMLNLNLNIDHCVVIHILVYVLEHFSILEVKLCDIYERYYELLCH